jgi:hypothetical protein
VEGFLVGGDEQAMRFTFAGRARWRKILRMGNREVVAFACIHCGNLQHQVRFTEQDRDRLASYDGPQPSVVADGEEPE